MNSLDLLDAEVAFGENSLNELEEILTAQKYKRILLITGKTSFQVCGAQAFFEKYNKSLSMVHVSYSGKALPIEDVQDIYQQISDATSIELIIGIGGGTILDLSKIMALMLSNSLSHPYPLLKANQFASKIKLILIPTTAGSGSEATSFAVVFKNKQKYSVNSNQLKPDQIILDANLLRSLPEFLLKISILDALSQSIESIWAVQANEESRRYAAEAISLIYQNIFEQYDLRNLSDFLLASHFSGKAINISKTTAAHAISYPLTSYYNIPHGLAVFLTLSSLAVFNYHAHSQRSHGQTSEEFKRLFHLFNVAGIDSLEKKLNRVFAIMNLSPRLRDYGITKNDVQFIAQNSIHIGRIDNNPATLNIRHISDILQKIF